MLTPTQPYSPLLTPTHPYSPYSPLLTPTQPYSLLLTPTLTPYQPIPSRPSRRSLRLRYRLPSCKGIHLSRSEHTSTHCACRSRWTLYPPTRNKPFGLVGLSEDEVRVQYWCHACLCTRDTRVYMYVRMYVLVCLLWVMSVCMYVSMCGYVDASVNVWVCVYCAYLCMNV